MKRKVRGKKNKTSKDFYRSSGVYSKNFMLTVSGKRTNKNNRTAWRQISQVKGDRNWSQTTQFGAN